jgi:hypothetical protein
MLGLSLRRTQLELQAHRVWLTAFSARLRISSYRNDGLAIATGHTGRGAPIRHYAQITPKHVRKRQLKQKREEQEQAAFHAAHSSLLKRLSEATQQVDIDTAIEIFDELPNHNLLHHNVVWKLAQCLHEAYRRASRDTETKDRAKDLLTFAERLMKLIRKGLCPPDTRAHVHLIGIFIEAGNHDPGLDFWKWLETQDDERFVNADVYGTAIELLAAHGTPLAELEELYERAMQRFPGDFNAYHLSPNAIVPDRAQPVRLAGLPISLLKGILTARLLLGDPRNAYMALDTALRLLPSQTPPRIFTLFIDERPIDEAYTVFAIACRAGVKLMGATAKRLMFALNSIKDKASPVDHVAGLRFMLNVIYLHVVANGNLPNNVARTLLIAITAVFRREGMGGLEKKEKQQIVDVVMGCIRKALEIFARYGAMPGLTLFNSIIINLGGYGQNKQVIGIALKDLESLRLQPDLVTRRSVLSAAGQLQEPTLVSKAWDALVALRAEAGEAPDATDYLCLIRAAKLSNAEDYAEEACQAMEAHGLTAGEQKGIRERLRGPPERTERTNSEGSSTQVEFSTLLRSLERFRADLDRLDDLTKENLLEVQDLKNQPAVMTLTPPDQSISLPEDEKYKLYDQLTTDPAAGPKDRRFLAAPAHSPTNIPYDVLRYENWKTVNHLLALAEKNDAKYHQAVDEAITKGVPPPPRDQVFTLAPDDLAKKCGLSEPEEKMVRPMNGEELERRRKEILRLRGLEG